MSDYAKWRPDPALWEKLKPLAREKRHEPTPAEDQLWDRLRNRQLSEAKFRRQHSIDRFIVDFYCREFRLVIEVDGDIHQYTDVEDAIRQEFLESLGFKVIRFSNDQVLNTLEEVVKQITDALTESTTSDSPSLRSGEGVGG